MKSIDIERVITERLKLETNQRVLSSEFGIEFASLNKVTSRVTLTKFKSWSEDKQNKFIITIGGRTNTYLTKQFINNLI